MEQLTTLDAGFLMAEDSDRHVSLAIGGVAVMQGSAPDQRLLKTILAERLHAIPRCRQLLRTYPFDVGAPQWVDDPDFEPSRHVRRVAAPRPGGDTELFQVIADVMERRLDRARPLWECWVIEGLEGNRWAILMKIHHSVADGISAIRILTQLCDAAERDTRSEPGGAHRTAGPPASSRPEAHPRVAAPNPLSWVPSMWRAASAVATGTARALTGATEIAVGLTRPTAGGALIGPVTTMRRYHAVRVSFADVENVCRRFDVTVNDVALAAITEGFRAALLNRGEQPRADSLRTLVPVSVRGPEALGKPDNRIAVMLPYLPVEQTDPVEQLQSVHNRLTRAKRGGQRQAGKILVSAANNIPFMLTSWAIRLLTRLPQRGIVTLATNVPGPRRRLRIMGNEVVSLLPVPPIALRLRTGIAVLSYADDLVFGITADYHATTDVDQLTDGIESALTRLNALSQGSVLLFPSDRADARPPAASAPGARRARRSSSA
ncbi:MAG TPA: wax ester/triacylglycerol synthase family O-acyltransferase [Mycobacterium sp.]|nr:wax ester/triacylglycerol synthase family O-acyltransferase [Mycobacterium sp.]